MSEGTITFDVLCRSDDPATCLAGMSNRKLFILITWLAAYSGGLPAILLAMAEGEASRRWQAETLAKQDASDAAGAMGEGYL